MFEKFETQAETEERLAAMSGQPVETAPEDIDETGQVCCPSAAYAAATLCGCGGYPL